MQFKVFHGVGVVVAEIKSDTLYSVMAVVDDPNTIDFTRTDLRFDVDLSRTPRRVSNWSKVVIDDRGVLPSGKELPPDPVPQQFALPLTCLGSGTQDTPARGAFVGGIYLEHAIYHALRDKHFPGWPTKWDPVQLTSVVTLEIDPLGNVIMRRFHGFIATVTQIVDDIVTVSFAAPDQTRTFTFRKDDATKYLLSPPPAALGAQPSLAANLALEASGALFIELGAAVATGLTGPKVPVGFGV